MPVEVCRRRRAISVLAHALQLRERRYDVFTESDGPETEWRFACSAANSAWRVPDCPFAGVATGGVRAEDAARSVFRGVGELDVAAWNHASCVWGWVAPH